MADERLREEETAAAAPQPRVGVIMGSDSDWSVMEDAARALAEFDVPFEVGVVSAHRTPARMLDYAQRAAGRGIEVIIEGAGGAAHLPGMVASATPLLVIGVPVLGAGTARRWRGPGIAGESAIAVGGLSADFWQAWTDNHALFPCGVDVVVTAGSQLLALPRSIAVEG